MKHRCYQFRSRISYLLLFMFVMAFSSSHAFGEKVVERSASKAPQWVMSHPEDYLVAISEGSSLQEAQGRVEQELLYKVMSAIGVNVQSETISESGIEGDREWDNFRNRVAARTAQLPFVSDVTLAKCKETYWEHSRDKSSGKESYRIFVLYPFDGATRQKLIDEYEAYDARMEATLVRLEKALENANDLEKVGQAEGELEMLVGWFPDEQRRTRAAKTLKLYRNINPSLMLVGEIISKGKCRVKVMRGDKIFHADGRLKATSNCASGIKVTPDANGWIVTFNTDDCLEDEDNVLNLSLSGGGIRLKTSVSF